jgi:hypothetical protein
MAMMPSATAKTMPYNRAAVVMGLSMVAVAVGVRALIAVVPMTVHPEVPMMMSMLRTHVGGLHDTGCGFCLRHIARRVGGSATKQRGGADGESDS